MHETIVKMENICKSFSGVPALQDAKLELKSGEVMALLGENGAGKSTLVKILSGVYTRDSGDIELFGKQVKELTPAIAKQNGIAIIHQELNMCSHLSVAENIFLGREVVKKTGVLDNATMNAEAKKILDSLKIDIAPTTTVGDLPVSKQQMVEIAKSLSTNAKILIMDEPTSALTDKEIVELFRIIQTLKEKGVGIVYISHRLEELSHIVDRVTIMRDGHFITDGAFADFTMDTIIENMVGRQIEERFPHIATPVGKEILRVEGLNAGRLVQDVSFSVKEGEILGIAGLMGAGRTETTRALFGVDKKESGAVFLDGKEVIINSPADAINSGIVLAPEDRRKDGLCVKLSVRENIVLPNLDLISSTIGVIRKRKEKAMVNNAIKNFGIKLSSAEMNAQNLSGGNQQKVVVAKWLSRNSRVVIFDEPTRGIDVGAKYEIYTIMNDLKKQGIGVVFVSSELPEILGMADRIIVMCDGRITGELPREGATQKDILVLATKFGKKVG